MGELNSIMRRESLIRGGILPLVLVIVTRPLEGKGFPVDRAKI